MDPAWIAIFVTVTVTIVGGLIAHIRDDAKTKERLARVEERIGIGGRPPQ